MADSPGEPQLGTRHGTVDGDSGEPGADETHAGARVSPLAVEDASQAARERLAQVVARQGHASNMVRTMAHAPSVLAGYQELARALKKGELSPRLREQIALAVASVTGCEYCQVSHERAARTVGLDDAEIADALEGRAADPAVAAVLRLAVGATYDPHTLTDADVAKPPLGRARRCGDRRGPGARGAQSVHERLQRRDSRRDRCSRRGGGGVMSATDELVDAGRWHERRSFRHVDFPAQRLAAEREASVSVCVPTRSCAATIGRTVDELVPAGTFDAVLCLGSSLGYRGEVGDRAALAELRRVLRPHGRLIISTLHADAAHVVTPAREERTLPGGALLRVNRSFDPAAAVLGEEQQLVDEDGSAPVRRYEMRVYRPAELAHLLCDAGFAGVAFQGDLLGGAFRPDGPLVLVAHAEGPRTLADGRVSSGLSVGFGGAGLWGTRRQPDTGRG